MNAISSKELYDLIIEKNRELLCTIAKKDKELSDIKNNIVGKDKTIEKQTYYIRDSTFIIIIATIVITYSFLTYKFCF